MNQSQLNSAIRSLLKIVGAALTAHGAQSTANLINTEDCIGLALIIGGLVWSHFGHNHASKPPPSKTPLWLWFTIGALSFGPLCGCHTSAAYKAAGVVTVTADRAADAWADYVVWQKRQASYDPNKLAAQEASVRTAEADYQLAMEFLFSTRKGFVAGQTTEETLAAQAIAAQNAGDKLLRLILAFLPTDRAATLTATKP